MNFPSQIFSNDLNQCYRAAVLKESDLWLFLFHIDVATYCYYKKVRRTILTAIVSYLLNENYAQQPLEVISHVFLIILERQCADQLSEGKYWLPSDLIRDLSKTVPSTNGASKGDFATLDLLPKCEYAHYSFFYNLGS